MQADIKAIAEEMAKAEEEKKALSEEAKKELEEADDEQELTEAVPMVTVDDKYVDDALAGLASL
jgi:phosphopantetheine adenylyltransferase